MSARSNRRSWRSIAASASTTGRSRSSRRATPKRDYYCQSARGNRLFELGLGEVALAFTATSSKTDQLAIAELTEAHGTAGFAAAWLRHRGLALGRRHAPGPRSHSPRPIGPTQGVMP